MPCLEEAICYDQPQSLAVRQSRFEGHYLEVPVSKSGLIKFVGTREVGNCRRNKPRFFLGVR
jgi:hypothetical protein